MNEEWAGFIYENRSLSQNFTHNFDYVYGGVADGAIHDAVAIIDQLKAQGVPKKDLYAMFFELIAYYTTYDQLLFHTTQSVDQNIIKLERVVHAHAKSRTFEDVAAN
jgi:hypothetical protein